MTIDKEPQVDRWIFSVTELEAGQRLDRVLASKHPSVSRTQIQQWIKAGEVLVDQQKAKAGQKVEIGQTLEVVTHEVKESTTHVEPVSLNLVYEDEDLLILNKPAGMTVHPGVGHATGTLVDALLERGQPLSSLGGAERPGIVHRLDKDTSGLMVIAKNDQVHAHLQQQFRDHQVSKCYLALVCGVPREEEGIIDAPISRHPTNRKRMAVVPWSDRQAISRWKRLQVFPGFSLMEVRPLTGRTHQVRVHMNCLGHPVVGDPYYGGARQAIAHAQQAGRRELVKLLEKLKGQLLHSSYLAFHHPITDQWLEETAPLPDHFQEILEMLSE